MLVLSNPIVVVVKVVYIVVTLREGVGEMAAVTVGVAVRIVVLEGVVVVIQFVGDVVAEMGGLFETVLVDK